jgi:hypothetical protein
MFRPNIVLAKYHVDEEGSSRGRGGVITWARRGHHVDEEGSSRGRRGVITNGTKSGFGSHD